MPKNLVPSSVCTIAGTEAHKPKYILRKENTMRNHRFTRILSALLSILMLAQLMCLSAFAAESTTVIIPAGSDTATVNEILSDALLGTGSQEEWEYHCDGKSSIGTKNAAWGTVAGFTSEKKVVFTTTTYTHPALADNEDGEYQVRVAGTSDEYTIRKLAKEELPAADISFNDGASAALAYNADSSLNAAATKAAIFDAVLECVDPVLTADDVDITYYATATSGAVGNMGKAWMPLEGGKKDLLTYPSIPAGEQQIRIIWAGSDIYQAFSKELTITMTEREEAPYALNDTAAQVKLSYLEDVSVDFDKLHNDIFNAVVAESDVLTADNVTISYHATAASGAVGNVGKAWMPLEGGKKDLLTYPSIPAGEQQIRIFWPGNEQYAPTTIETSISVADRDALQFNLKEGPYEAGLVFDKQLNYDYDATAKAIIAAVVESTEPQVSTDEITVEYNCGTDLLPIYKALDNSDNLTKKFGEGTWSIKLSWAGSREYAKNSVTVNVTVSDSRTESNIVLKDGVSFTYTKDTAAIKQIIFDKVIDWNNSDLPAKNTLSVDDFTFTYKAKLSLLDGAAGDAISGIVDKVISDDKIQTAYVPLEGLSYDVLGQTVGAYPAIGAGENEIKVVYNGNADFKPGNGADGKVTVKKANVWVNVKSTSMYVSQVSNDLDLVSTTPDDDFNTYVIYNGLTNNVTINLYLQLPAKYTENAVVVKTIDNALAALGRPTLSEMMRNGISLGELREMLNAAEVINALEKLGVNTGVFGQIISTVSKLPSIGDNIRVGIGAPNTAGVYSVTAITENKNYNTGLGVGVLILKADHAALTWNQDIGWKISAEDVQNADFGATLTVNGEAVKDQSNVHVLYSGMTSKLRVYSSTTTAPTEPGTYTMTVSTLGGNYLALPIVRTFQITK